MSRAHYMTLEIFLFLISVSNFWSNLIFWILPRLHSVCIIIGLNCLGFIIMTSFAISTKLLYFEVISVEAHESLSVGFNCFYMLTD